MSYVLNSIILSYIVLHNEAANSLVEKDNKTGQYIWRPGLAADKDGAVNIDKELKPLLGNSFESLLPILTKSRRKRSLP